MSLRSFTQHGVIERNAHLHASRTAFLFAGQQVTHAEYARRVARLAAGLAAAGVRAGDRVAMLAANCQEYADLFGAAARLAAIVVPINWRLSAQEVAYVVEDVTPKVLLVSAELQALLPQALCPGMLRYTLGGGRSAGADVGELYVSALHVDGDMPPPAPAELAADTGFVIIHTAAVGGRPRGALLSHGGLMAASVQAQLAWRLAPTDVNLGVLPLFHIGGIGLMLAAQMAGAATLLLPRFDAQAVVAHIDNDGGSLIGSFAPMLGALLDAATAQGSALPTLRVVTGIDAPATIARLQAQCPGATFWTTYGQTETSGQVCMAPYDERPGSAGRPTAFNTLAVADELDRILEVGGSGEILVRGPMVFQGYWGRHADNAFTLRNGWHHTGDLGRFDADGYLWYAGRSPAKELIKPGGENVYPGEVESAILEHPALAGAVVIGVPDKEWGEAVKAICVLRAGHALAAQALIDFVGQRIARYKKPKQVVFVQALPLTAAGLPDRAAIKAEHGAPQQPS